MKDVLEEIKDFFGDCFVYQQDWAAAHGAKSTMEFFAKNGIQVLENYPSQSCCFNPIEKIWSWMEPKVPLERRQNKVEFENALLDAWEGIDQKSIDKQILSVKKLC